MRSAIVHPSEAIQGAIRVPGDKSISHRAALLAGLASGTSTIGNFLRSADCLHTLRAMETLGARVRDDGEGADVVVEGTAGTLREPAETLYVGNSGTSMRLLAGLIASHPVTVEMSGDASLNSRPMRRIKEPLERMGASVELRGPRDGAPMRIRGGRLKGIDYPLPVASAQVKSCVLLATLWADGETIVTEPAPTRDHTERMLAAAGVQVDVDGLVIRMRGCGGQGPAIAARAWTVPGDFSSAAFHLTAAAARPGASLTVEGVGLNPRRTALLAVLQRMGAAIAWAPGEDDALEPSGNIEVSGRTLSGTIVEGAEIPNLIDELPLVAVAAALADGETVIRDAAELRVKESDRIATMASNLLAMGVDVEERPDGMRIRGGRPLNMPEAGLKSYGDHRIAMAMAVLALQGNRAVRIDDVACVGTSYPGFWDDLGRLGAHVEA